jgi:tetratricopeptide (TPR) repeat protein
VGDRRLDELRRRVGKDPASIAFAALAEELRKAGDLDEAIRVCRSGLEHHPSYLSAHVTLGRALLDLQQYAEARMELEYVVKAAPDNLLAQKGLNELNEREGDGALPEREPGPAIAESVAPAIEELVPPPVNPALGHLEQWHARIQADRAQRTR